MIPIHVALVACYADDYVNAETVLRLAAALQIQLTRDFTPIWGIPAVLSPFESLDEVPPASIPLVIVEPGSLHPRAHGFHITDGGQPIGLVEGGPGWSLAASHELLEIVCDPEGKRKVPGESIVDLETPMEFVLGGDQYSSPQGQVAYLLEVCDPCQADRYTVNGIEVSDFVTPRYYAPSETQVGGYSFTGEVTTPLQIRRGGYISWYTSIAEAPIWQATNTDDILRVGPLAVPAPSFSRHRVDYFTDVLTGVKPVASRRNEAANEEELAPKPAERYGDKLRDEVDRLLAGYQADRKWRVAPAELLKILNKLVDEPNYWEGFRDDPNALFDQPELKDLLPRGSAYPGWRLPSKDVFVGVRDWVERHANLSADPVTGMVATTMMKGTIPWPPPPPPPPRPPGGR